MRAEEMLSLGQVFTLLFVTLGPLKVLGPFAQRTHAWDEATTRQVALRAFLVATAAAIGGGQIGRILMLNWQVSIAAMTLTGGIIFFLVALQSLLEQYEPPRAAAAEPLPGAPMAAALRLVFPTVLTPYGIAAVIALLAASDSGTRTAAILGLLLLVMALNLLAMLSAKRVVAGGVSILLQVVGAVLAVLQVALAVQLILRALRELRVIDSV